LEDGDLSVEARIELGTPKIPMAGTSLETPFKFSLVEFFYQKTFHHILKFDGFGVVIHGLPRGHWNFA